MDRPGELVQQGIVSLSMMPRLHKKRFVAVSLTLIVFCLLVFVLLHKHAADPYDRGVPAIDPELWKVLGPQPTPKVKILPPTPVRPEVHVKQLPVLSQTHGGRGDVNMNVSIAMVETRFFQYLENKDIRCEKDMRLGNIHDGGWNVCMSPPFSLVEPCVVFSFGIGNDWQFDDSISNIYKCKVLAFDPSMTEPNRLLNPLIRFKPIGIGARNEINKDGWELKTLGQHLKDEGYWEVPVDYVKIDIEHMEWEVLKAAFSEGSLKHVKQLGFEMHTQRMFNLEGGSELSEKLDMVHMFETLRQVEILGFKKFNYRKNPFGSYKSSFTKAERSYCYELHYINTEFLDSNHTVVHKKDSKLFH